jgi:putative ABC transport system ATP-binding protein
MGEVTIDALRNVDLEIEEGELLVIVGPSGSGKSTLLHLLGGIEVPSTGELTFGGQDLTNADDAALTTYRCYDVGFVFQFYNLIPSLTSRENVEIVTDLVARSMPAEDAIRLVGLEAREDHFPWQLSGGEQQRVAIARAIAKRPRVLLCDEPTGALDVETGRVVALEQVNREFGTTVVIITHNAAIAAIANRVMTMSSGEIVNVAANANRRPVSELNW